MSLFLSLVSILKVFSTSLGVGTSTLAITNFFVAIADGFIDETERRMMGVVYVVLRIAMVAILITTGILVAQEFSAVGFLTLAPVTYIQIVILLTLYVNALLMTAHLVSTTVGPALQAGSWYALGILLALQSTASADFTLTQFLLGYISWLVLAIGIVNGIMAVIKNNKHYHS
ncbi:hypothetical protein GW937_00495 [Candidatus Kaiserbacteria bacterium]|nr:hypothetical protein [Candidatus Kaiserbacteria bacterium]NCT02023.1 hypothetical protein [Candidatus Parcubacteria bacterium]